VERRLEIKDQRLKRGVVEIVGVELYKNEGASIYDWTIDNLPF